MDLWAGSDRPGGRNKSRIREANDVAVNGFLAKCGSMEIEEMTYLIFMLVA